MVTKLLRNVESYRSSVVVNDMPSRIAVESFLTVTPSRCTSEGSDGSARLTRFCVCTTAVSMFVPRSNVTSTVSTPSFELREKKYSIPSSATNCCSIGCATVRSRSCAFAPRKLAVIWTTGGTTSG